MSATNKQAGNKRSKENKKGMKTGIREIREQSALTRKCQYCQKLQGGDIISTERNL